MGIEEISEYQRNNIVKLYNYLKTLPEDYEHFDMKYYHTVVTDDDILHIKQLSDINFQDNCITACGTVACVAGHGPYAGIGNKEDWQFWGEYCDKHLIEYESFSVEWHFLFSATWNIFAPTLKDAIQRLEYFILNQFTITEQWSAYRYGEYNIRFDMVKDWESYLNIEIEALRLNGATIPDVK